MKEETDMEANDRGEMNEVAAGLYKLACDERAHFAQQCEALKAELAVIKESRTKLGEQEQRVRVECNRLRDELAEARKNSTQPRKMFPIQDGPSVPFEVMVPHESQCKKNHMQSIQRISERGGFGAGEAWAVVNGLDCFKAIEGKDGIGWPEAKRRWVEFAERINLHYVELDLVRKELVEKEASLKSMLEASNLRTPNNWCHGVDLGNGEVSGCACDCPACKARAEREAALADAVQRVKDLLYVIQGSHTSYCGLYTAYSPTLDRRMVDALADQLRSVNFAVSRPSGGAQCPEGKERSASC